MFIRKAPSPTEGSRTVVEYWTIDSFSPGRETMASTISLGVNTSPCCWTRLLLLIKTSFSANILTHFRITEITKFSAKQCLLIFNYTCQSSRMPFVSLRAQVTVPPSREGYIGLPLGEAGSHRETDGRLKRVFSPPYMIVPASSPSTRFDRRRSQHEVRVERAPLNSTRN